MPYALDNSAIAAGAVACRPFLKWVGGKAQLLPELVRRLPLSYKRYFEPFVGGGALFFATQQPGAYLSDINPELINCFRVVQTELQQLIQELKVHRYEKQHFYSVRDADLEPEFSAWPAAKRAARIIFLNKCCFNGLYRVNSKGHFNVPFGRYTNPKILDVDNLQACSLALASAEIRLASFLEVKHVASAGDFVYFDPPYVPLSASANFTAYSSAGFDATMQQQLFELCQRLDAKHVQFMLSNSSAPYVQELYRTFRVELVSAVRAVNSKGDKRGKVQEVIVRNY